MYYDSAVLTVDVSDRSDRLDEVVMVFVRVHINGPGPVQDDWSLIIETPNRIPSDAHLTPI